MGERVNCLGDKVVKLTTEEKFSVFCATICKRDTLSRCPDVFYCRKIFTHQQEKIDEYERALEYIASCRGKLCQSESCTCVYDTAHIALER